MKQNNEWSYKNHIKIFQKGLFSTINNMPTHFHKLLHHHNHECVSFIQ